MPTAYSQKRAVKPSESSVTSAEAPSRRTSTDEEIANTKYEHSEVAAAELPALAAKDELRNLGYLDGDQNLLFGNAAATSSLCSSSNASDATSPEMKNVLRLLPPKPYTDLLIQRYLGVINFNYYCLYPPAFSQDYASWWSDRANGKSLTPAFTCLLIRVCACTLQYLDAQIQQKIESELGEPVQSLSENYHHAAKQLSNTIAPGKGSLAQIQQLFLTAVWFKSESLFVESWHTLSSCIHEAQEQGLHKNSPRTGLSEFDIEMRRRLWCLLYVWDWQMSLLLSRPPIINSSYSSFELPNMQLESQATENGPPSPVTHIAVQVELGRIMSKEPATIGCTFNNTQAESFRSDIDEWFASLHPAYQETNPDTQWDSKHLYVPLQRRQLHAIGYMMMLLPFKSYLTRTFNSESTEVDRGRRVTAIDIALHLMEVSRLLFDHIFPLNAKFHLITFLIFDTAAFLCSAMIHDKDRTLPRCDNVIQAIGLACTLMEKLAPITKTAAICYPVLSRLAKSLSKAANRAVSLTRVEGDISKMGVGEFGCSPGLDALSFGDPFSSYSLDPMATELFLPASLGITVPGMETPPVMGVGDFTNLDVGQFDQIWDWQNLDLTLLPTLPT
ncbi:uncharacterized protein N7443_001138 [Penicillium atrosanguineum]|uniref:uncharacterized protein n=1 Tax=Penicillium atrosanguineum TaxID=1132637 RepID=UPI0023892ABC|nr:uncharacterized protein N7443_001138 [Penicillium atrosanguineum]KAJ5314254.1 hypothetical protein N7443_001138 [Penicillium atrosanguineum]